MATAGRTDVVRGKWSGRVLSSTGNAMHGSWTVLNEAKQTLMQGTWSAKKSASGWRGTWSARTLSGQSLFGVWTADLGGFSGKTFEEMLERAAEAQIAGSWRIARRRGNWWLQRSP